jgi:predicted amidohydrolase YtcJ
MSTDSNKIPSVLVGRVLTVDASDTEAQAVAFKGGRVAAVGDRSIATSGESAGHEVLDFGERPVLPGFIDPHAHVEVGCRARSMMVDCRAPRCAGISDVLDALRDSLDRADESGWLVGQANLFLDQKLTDGRMPTRHDLDKVSRKGPIALRAGGHLSVLNSRAFELSPQVLDYVGRAGMTGGAVVELDSAGEPTGVIAELDNALDLPEPNRDELQTAIEEGTRELFTAYGVTSIGEISETLDGLHSMDALLRAGTLSTRMSIYLWAPGTLSIKEACRWERHLEIFSDRDWFDVRGLKLFADGGYSARNAATRGTYLRKHALRPGSRGKVNLNRRQIALALGRAREAGLQLAVHANGERAQAVVCAGIEAQGPTNGDLPVRLEHAGNLVTSSETTDAWRRAGIIPVPQATFLYNFGGFLPVYLGEHGSHGRFPFRSLTADGWQLPLSSDITLGAEERQTNPLFGIWCAMERRSFKGDLVEPHEAVGFDEALRMYTINGAAALGVEADRGSLEPGKLGDAVVLERDPRSVPASELPDIKVDYVFVGGELAYRRDGARPPATHQDHEEERSDGNTTPR